MNRPSPVPPDVALNRLWKHSELVQYAQDDDYPTTYVMEPDDDGGLFVSMDEFEGFPGPSE